MKRSWASICTGYVCLLLVTGFTANAQSNCYTSTWEGVKIIHVTPYSSGMGNINEFWVKCVYPDGRIRQGHAWEDPKSFDLIGANQKNGLIRPLGCYLRWEGASQVDILLLDDLNIAFHPKLFTNPDVYEWIPLFRNPYTSDIDGIKDIHITIIGESCDVQWELTNGETNRREYTEISLDELDERARSFKSAALLCYRTNFEMEVDGEKIPYETTLLVGKSEIIELETNLKTQEHAIFHWYPSEDSH